MKENNLSEKELKELEEMARIGRDTFPGDLSQIEERLAQRIDTRAATLEAQTPSNRFLKIGLLFLVIAVIALALLNLVRPRENVTPAFEYAMAYYDTPPFMLSDGVRGEGSGSVEIDKVSGAYKAKEFEQLLSLTTDRDDSYVNFYRAIALIELDRPDEALPLLNQNLGDDLGDMRQWYLALCQLRLNDQQSAILSLKSIASIPQHYKQRQALELLDKLHIN